MDNVQTQKVKVQVSHLTKKFGDLLVLNDMSFDVNRGDLLCVVGPTGCGKTTFLNCLTNIYDITSGQVLLDGKKVDCKKNNLAYIFQGNTTMPWLTVEQNVAFGLMDEPYGQLDIELRFRLEDELVKLWKMTGTTVIFITHNVEEAVYISNRIMVLTNKPTSVKQIMNNDLPRPRDIASPEFVELRNRVTEAIRWW